MSDGSSGGLRLSKNDQSKRSKNERREAAREKARQLREQHQKKERRGRIILQGSVVGALLAAVIIVVLVISNSVRPPASGPLNMASDGIIIGTKFDAVPTGAVKAGSAPVATKETPGMLSIRIYLDYLCPVCGQFEKTNAEQITTLVMEGVATLEVHPVAILDRVSQGSRYSTRAANAAACVANYSPNTFFDFSAEMYAQQPDENTAGLTDAQLISITKKVGAAQQSKISSCITKIDFDDWVQSATARAVDDPALQGTQGFGTPTVLVNGKMFTGSVTDPTDFAKFLAAADGEASAQKASESPSPLPSPAP